ncbi:hypothetical protein [Bradymonas sediminis]|uniref:Uncharacterized protein n=1 Tax=Bradymonas sediminis TaxID=1548548 RepID=A0A2Z4FQZ4_9DELT|nr:hypothetical protein [Bradymonas sediminis]AWV91038.1 hypothetical protein DN745_17560 [Bradymonas sediminis]TDP75221.1 hypothetical protein DFR33_10486 [Bradymonas sediminis]
MNKRERVSQILSRLEYTGEDLLDLSDDIWLGIDHNNPDELEEGVAFKREYNKAMTEFARVSENIQRLIADFTQVKADDEATPADADSDNIEHERIIRELDRTESHTLDEDFRYKRPFGFVFKDHAVKDLRTWRAVYEHACHMLVRLQGEAFKRVTVADEFATNRGNRIFADTGENMRLGVEISPGLFAEMNFSANDIRDRIKELLTFFGYDWGLFIVYLREDRDAD